MSKPSLRKCQRIFILTAFGTLARMSQAEAMRHVKRLEQLERAYKIEYLPLGVEGDGRTLAIISPEGKTQP